MEISTQSSTESVACGLPEVWRTRLTAHEDPRGTFVECFRAGWLETGTKVSFPVAQANLSISGRGVLRGVHYFADETGQAKYVTCAYGEVLDVVVDLRVGSPHFAMYAATRMNASERHAVYVPRGFGHAFIALSDEATMLYLCDTEYVPGVELAVDPLDPRLALPWPLDLRPILSERDGTAPSLLQARELGLLPRF